MRISALTISAPINSAMKILRLKKSAYRNSALRNLRFKLYTEKLRKGSAINYSVMICSDSSAMTNSESEIGFKRFSAFEPSQSDSKP